jgi:hypothetical protein
LTGEALAPSLRPPRGDYPTGRIAIFNELPDRGHAAENFHVPDQAFATADVFRQSAAAGAVVAEKNYHMAAFQIIPVGPIIS